MPDRVYVLAAQVNDALAFASREMLDWAEVRTHLAAVVKEFGLPGPRWKRVNPNLVVWHGLRPVPFCFCVWHVWKPTPAQEKHAKAKPSTPVNGKAEVKALARTKA